jgi:hypothetical protein
MSSVAGCARIEVPSSVRRRYAQDGTRALLVFRTVRICAVSRTSLQNRLDNPCPCSV